MNKQIIQSYIKAYKDNFEFVNQQEIYKWKAVKQFQENWNIDAPDFYSMLEKSLKLAYNLLDSGQYFPKGMLLEITKIKPNEIRSLFKNLYNEESDIFKRIEKFRSSFKKINEAIYPGKSDYQDHRAVIVYLALRFPERYYFYKQRMFKSFSEIIDYNYKSVAGRIENIGQYQTLCDLLKHELSKDQELLKLHKDRITDDCYYDDNLNILTQDFIYAVVRHLESINTPESSEVIATEVSKLNSVDIIANDPEIDFTPKNTNYTQNNIENKRIGDLGELWVIKWEKQKLQKANKPILASKIQHVAKNKGDGLGYDILSFDQEGHEIFIEVKTTKGNFNSTFYITRNELERSKIEKDSYKLYRIYDFNEDTNHAKIKIIEGDLSNLAVDPVNFRINILKESTEKIEKSKRNNRNKKMEKF